MNFVNWCGLFNIGHAVIDEQHQELTKLVNKFHKEMQKTKRDQLMPDVEKTLSDWLIIPILREDMKFKYHLKNR